MAWTPSKRRLLRMRSRRVRFLGRSHSNRLTEIISLDADTAGARIAGEEFTMSIVSRFEAAMQGLFEGSIGRVFRAGVQEAELKDRLELAMVDGAIKTRDGLVAPRRYDIYLSRDDYNHFMQSKVWEKLTIHLDNVNRQRGYRITPGWSWRIRLHEDD